MQYTQLIENSFPLPIKNIKEIQEGWDFVVIEVNKKWMFRFPRRASGLQQLEKEIALLPLLDSVLPVQVPCYKYVRLEGDQPYGGYQKITGTPLSSNSLYMSNQFATQIGKCLTTLHTIDLENLSHISLDRWTPKEWKSQYLQVYKQFKQEAFPLLPIDIKKHLQEKWEELLKQPQFFSFQPCFIHKDLTVNHLLVEGDRLVGIIDWGDACIGDPALDFAGLESFFGSSFTLQLIKYYHQDIDPTFRKRVRFYSEWIYVHQILHALEDNRQDLLHTSILKLRANHLK